MNNSTLKIAFIGHIDHGKSTLLGRILLETNSLAKGKMEQIKRVSQELGKNTELAFLTDQLKEERDGDLTIDTTQFFLKIHKKNYVFIDNPGHFHLIKNMLTGTTQTETAILVIDIKQGFMEQTRIHAEIISMLGIDQIIVVFNKMDLINYSEQKFIEAKNEILKFLKTLDLDPVFVIPISAKEGVNISKKSSSLDWYKGPCMVKAIGKLKLKTQSKEKPLRFAIQNRLEINKEKIVTGQVISGVIKKGQEITILPSLKITKVDSIRIFKKPNTAKAYAGQCIGLTLKNSLLGQRGDIITSNVNMPTLTNRIKGNVFWMLDQPLKNNMTLTLRSTTQEIQCIVQEIKRKMSSNTPEDSFQKTNELNQNEIGIVILKTQAILIAEKFSFIKELGRFILEKDNKVCACGIITHQLYP